MANAETLNLLFARPHQVAGFPVCISVDVKVKKLALLLHIAKCLEFETKEGGYRAGGEIFFPPPPPETLSEWDAVKDYLLRSNWEATLCDDGCVKLVPLPR